jgi:CRP-like cAMP-binding protein
LVTNRELSVYIILRGEAQVYFMRRGREREVVVLGEGDVIGDISMLIRMAAVVSVRVRGELEVTEIPAKEFRSALSDLPAIAEKAINAFVVRRKWLESMDDFSGVLQIVGRKRDPEAFQLVTSSKKITSRMHSSRRRARRVWGDIAAIPSELFGNESCIGHNRQLTDTLSPR